MRIRNILTLSLVVLILSCASMGTPYQPEGFSGGYIDYPISEGVTEIRVRGNGFTNLQTLQEYARRRASELCPGGYKLIDNKSGCLPGSLGECSETVTLRVTCDKTQGR